MINIFALPSHQTLQRTSAVDFARVIQPMKELNKQKGFKVHLYDINKDAKMVWDEVAEKNDAVFFNYMSMPWEFAKMGTMMRKHNKLMVLDLDDSLWHIMEDNPAYNAIMGNPDYLKNFTAICNEVDYITTTNKHLRNLIAHNTSKPINKIKVLPNYIDLDNLYTHRTKFKDDYEIKLVHFGSTTHFIDLQTEQFEQGVDRIMKEYPNVVFRTIGALIPKYKYKWGRRYENSFGHQDVYKWIETRFPQFMDEADIFVTPLQDNKYTRCKSAIKFLEASSAKIPGVWQGMRQYESVVDGENGLLAYSADDWYENIKILIDNKELRREMGEKAFKTVEKDWQMQKNIEKYMSFFTNIL